YAELECRAGRVARSLDARCGTGPGRVALILSHDAPMLAAVLGALAAGKTYVALDPMQPAERLHAIIQDADVVAVLADAAGRAALGNAGDIALTNGRSRDSGRATGNPADGHAEPPVIALEYALA